MTNEKLLDVARGIGHQRDYENLTFKERNDLFYKVISLARENEQWSKLEFNQFAFVQTSNEQPTKPLSVLTLETIIDDTAIIEGKMMPEHTLHMAQLELPIEHLMKAQIKKFKETF